MNLADLYEQHQKNIEKFEALRDKAWEKVLSDNERLVAAFGSRENMSEDALKTHNNRIATFNAEWSMQGGSRFNDLQDQHERQLNAATGNTKFQSAAKQSNSDSERPTLDKTTRQKFNNQAGELAKKAASVSNENKLSEEKRQLREKIAKQQAAIKARNQQKKRGR